MRTVSLSRLRAGGRGTPTLYILHHYSIWPVPFSAMSSLLAHSDKCMHRPICAPRYLGYAACQSFNSTSQSQSPHMSACHGGGLACGPAN